MFGEGVELADQSYDRLSAWCVPVRLAEARAAAVDKLLYSRPRQSN